MQFEEFPPQYRQGCVLWSLIHVHNLHVKMIKPEKSKVSIEKWLGGGGGSLTCPSCLTATLPGHRVTAVCVHTLTLLSTVQPVSSLLNTGRHDYAVEAILFAESNLLLKNKSAMVENYSSHPASKATLAHIPQLHSQLENNVIESFLLRKSPAYSEAQS